MSDLKVVAGQNTPPRETCPPTSNASLPNSECECCTGECPKEAYRYLCEQRDGEGVVSYMPCPYSSQRNLRGKYKQSGLPSRYANKTFDSYKVTEDNEQAVKLGKWFSAKRPARSLYLYGGVGTGKTFLASLIAKEFLTAEKTVVFGDVPTFLDAIKRTFDGKGDTQAVIDKYGESDLLILDDLGAGQLTDWSVGILYQIINRRYNDNKPIVVTSNFDMKNLEGRLASKDSYSAARIISRLSEMCLEAFLGTKDRRC